MRIRNKEPAVLDWNDLRTIAEVTRQGSMSGAARALELHPTSVSRRISTAEERLGEPLFLRSGRRLVPTPLGARITQALDPFVHPIDAVARRASRTSTQPVRLACTSNGGRLVLMSVLPLLRERSPEIELDVLASDATVDLAAGEADLAIRVVEPSDPSLIRRRIGTIRHALYASAAYLDAHPVGSDLAGHALLLPSGRLASSPVARYLAANADRARVVARCSSLVALATAVEAGLGLAVLPTDLVPFHPALVEVRPVVEVGSRPLWLTMHEDLRSEPRVRAVADAVVEGMGRVLDAATGDAPSRPENPREPEPIRTRGRPAR